MFAERNGGLGAAPAALEAPERRHIWLCADDYGISTSVNVAIRDLIVRGRLNATSVMVVAPAFHRSEAIPLNVLNSGTSRAALASEASGQRGHSISVRAPDTRPEPGSSARVAIGLHLTLTAPFRPLSATFEPHEDGAFLPLARTLTEAFLHRLSRDALRAEITGQLRAFFDAFGRPPDFIDGHQHVHLFPQVSEAVLEVAKETAPNAWVRQCGRVLPLRERFHDRKGLLLDLLSIRFRRRAAARGVRVNPGFAGTYDFKERPDFAALFPRFLDRLPHGSVVMCHPGFVDAELQRLDPLTTLREQEYAFFAGEAFPAVLAARGVALA